MLLRGKAARLRDSGRKLVLAAQAAMEQGHQLQKAVTMALDEVPLQGSERRQGVDLVYNTVRLEERAQYVLSTVFPKFGRFPKPVQTLLLAAAASLLAQERAPVHAVLNETVSDARHFAGNGCASAVNGGLRALTRLGDAPKKPDFYKRPDDLDDYQAFLRHASVPRELGELVRREIGEERARTVFLKSLERPRQVVRLNARAEGFEALRERLVEKGAVPLPGAAGICGLDVTGLGKDEGKERDDPGAGPNGEDLRQLSEKGLLSFQSAGSQLALAAFDLADLSERDGQKLPWWDMCAGFGGKTCAMLERGLDVLLATDTSSTRLKGLPRECERLGITCPKTLLADGTRPPFASWQGSILLDIPCSGLGVLSRRPDIKRRMPDLAAHAATQKALLSSAAQLVKPGAHVVYITCTVTRTENEDVVCRAAKELGLALEGEWRTPEESPFEDMYAALMKKA